MKTLDVLTYTYDGNRLTRMEESDMADANGNIEEYNHYYPYGALMNISSASTQPYKYNGKELNRLNRLLWYDQSARQYNPILGRFMSMDPLCEKYYSISPYAFCSEHCAEAAKAQRKKKQQEFIKAVEPVIDIASQEYLTFSKAAIEQMLAGNPYHRVLPTSKPRF